LPILELSLIAIGLSADAFAVSISNGLCMKKFVAGKMIAIAAAFGVFQALMPLCGYLHRSVKNAPVNPG
jgi:putative Mn2+ efflux pump MntP